MALTGQRPSAPSTGNGVPSERTIRPRRGLPGGRAVIGGLLIALAALAAFAASTGVGSDDGTGYVVAARDIREGQVLGPDDVELATIDLPAGVAGSAQTSIAEVEGTVATVGITAGDLVERGDLVRTDGGTTGGPAAEFAFPVDASVALGGALEPGDTIQVLATYGSGSGSRTRVVLNHARVLAVPGVDEGQLGEGSSLVITVAVPDQRDRLNIANAAAEATLSVVRTTGLNPANRDATISDDLQDSLGDLPEEDDPSGESPAPTTPSAGAPGDGG